MTEPSDDGRPLKELPFPEARELAELLLLEADIRHSYNALKLWAAKYGRDAEATNENSLIAISLFRDAVVQFVGCFDGTAQYKLSFDDVYGGAPDALAFFRWIKDIRDSYAAHKFGPLRQCVIGAIAGDSFGVTGIGHLTYLYLGPTETQPTIDKIGVAGRYVENRIKALQAVVLEKSATLSPEQVSALPNAKVHGVPNDSIRTTRSRFSTSRRDEPA